MPTKQNNITIYLGKRPEAIVEEAVEIMSLNKSSFCRMASVKEAKKIIRENNFVEESV